jgi:hypothetical protein
VDVKSVWMSRACGVEGVCMSSMCLSVVGKSRTRNYIPNSYMSTLCRCRHWANKSPLTHVLRRGRGSNGERWWQQETPEEAGEGNSLLRQEREEEGRLKAWDSGPALVLVQQRGRWVRER